MEKKWNGIIQGKVLCKALNLIMAVWVCLCGVTTVFAQTGNPAFEAKVDSLKQVYMNQGIPEASAEKRARARALGEYKYSQLIMPTGGVLLNPALGSIAVNRDAKFVAYTPEQLVDSVFVKSSVCSSVSNVTLRAHGWDGSAWTSDSTNRGLGYFSQHNAAPHIFEFAEGLVLSTGGLRAIEGPNGDTGDGSDGGFIPPASDPVFGDPDLEVLEYRVENNGGDPDGPNVTVLEFDFVPANSVMTFRYIFASEEYLEWANSEFNDVFGFFIDGPGISGGMGFTGDGINIATLPIPGDPFVAINNINWGFVSEGYHNSASSSGFVEPGPTFYDQTPHNPDYYINIPGGWMQVAPAPVLTPTQDSLRMSMEFDGRTVVLTATCTVIPCELYHLKLAIANASDNVWQSAVFLEAHSFDIGANMENYGSMNRNQTIIYRGCTDNQFALFRPCTDDAQADTTIYLTYSGTCLPNITSPGGLPLPDHVVIPQYVDTVYVPYNVNTTDAGAGHRTFNVHSEVKGVCGGTYTMTIDLYDTSNPNDFQATATLACPGQSNGTITVTTGTGGSGVYESSIDGGVTWQTSTLGYTYTGLPSDDYTVFIRDVGGCSYITRYVSTIFPRALSGSINLCPPTWSTTLTAPAGVSFTYQWYKDGTAIAGAIYQNYAATALGEYYAVMSNGVCNAVSSDTLTLSSDNCLWAYDDFSQTLREMPDTISVLDNDIIPGICLPAVVDSILTPQPQLEGLAYINSSGDKVIFIPAPGFTGEAVFTYQIVCGTDTATAQVTVRVHAFPDNVIDIDCWGKPVPKTWGMTVTATSQVNLSPYEIAMVGDVDGCGIPEIIVCMNPVDATVGGITRPSSQLAIYKGNNLSAPWKTINTNHPYTWGNITKYGIVKTVIDNKDTTLIVVAESDLYLRAYNYNGGSPVWTSNAVYHSTNSDIGYQGTAPAFADFNNDGIPEIMVKGKIFNSVNGQLLCAAPDPQFPKCAPIAADLFNTGKLNLIVGNRIYTPDASLSTLILERTITLPVNPIDTDIPSALGARPAFTDGGLVSAVDIDHDGKLELIYMVNRSGLASPYVGEALICVVDPVTGNIKASKYIPYAPLCSWPFVGDIDGCGFPEIVFITSRANVAPPNATEQPYWLMHAYKYVGGNPLLQKFWTLQHQDGSGMTGMTIFDFNQDGIMEIVYRDEQNLRIINGSLIDHLTGLPVTSPYNLASVPNTSGTGTEYPVVADVDGDGQAEIAIVGGTAARTTLGSLRVYKTDNLSESPWAPARKVWHQHAYSAVNINEDLTVPQYQLSPATLFPNGKRPYNNFLQQQTELNPFGDPLWRLPDLDYDNMSLIVSDVVGDSVSITVTVINKGDALIGPPIYVALYKETIPPQLYTSAELIAVDSAMITLLPDSIGQVTVRIPDITTYPPFANIVIRLNDNGVTFPYYAECDTFNNDKTVPNPARHLLMKKRATLLLTPPFPHNGTMPNPVAMLFTDTVEYRISAINGYVTPMNIQIIDTLPAYLDYVPLSSNQPVTQTTLLGVPLRDKLVWSFSAVIPTDSAVVTFRATLPEAVSASQPLLANKAYVAIQGDTVPTNVTWHQGAGVMVVTFSAGFGGKIYQATEQVLDYRTTPHAGVIIVPDEGYRFAGWSHADYLSLRGEMIQAQSGIMLYDTLTIYGDVELHADFELEDYPIVYHLNGGYFPSVIARNEAICSHFSIESPSITLEVPQKASDVFVGWTGANGDEPQLTVTIPAGSTGERAYYAHFLFSGQEEIDPQPILMPSDDMIWVAQHELYVRTAKAGSILRIYTLDGVLQQQQAILHPGETKYKLASGLYIVTLNNGIGQKVMVD